MGQPNKDAIAMLEQAVALDPNYAPAWEALGRRYYFDAIYSGGGRRDMSGQMRPTRERWSWSRDG